MEGEKKRILIFWQDQRVRKICHVLTDAGYEVGIAGCTLPAGMPRSVSLYPQFEDQLPKSDIVLLPLPTLRSGGIIAFSEREIPFASFLRMLRPGTVLLSGMLPPVYAAEAEREGMTVLDYYNAEAVMLRNAELTAEGAISIAMQELPLAMDEWKAAVVGCGRIGTALCKILSKLHADVTAVSRNEASLALPRALGCRCHSLSSEMLSSLTKGYDVVFTTVPHRIFDREVLSHAETLAGGRGTLYIDLSSSPGSFDSAAAREQGIRLLWALSLPGKYAPDSAGTVLAKQMLLLLKAAEAEGGL